MLSLSTYTITNTYIYTYVLEHKHVEQERDVSPDTTAKVHISNQFLPVPPTLGCRGGQLEI